MFTKDKKRAGEKKPVPQKKRPGQVPEQPRRRPAGMTDRIPEGRKPAETVRPAGRPAAAVKKDAEAAKRKPAESRKNAEMRKPMGRSANGETAVRRPGKPERRPGSGQPRPKIAEGRTPAEKQPVTQTEKTVSGVLQPSEGSVSQAQAEDQVFQIRQEPRRTPATSRTAGRQKKSRQTEKPARPRKSSPPQGTSYHRSTPKQKKNLGDWLRQKKGGAYADPDEQAAAARKRQENRAEQKKKLQKMAAKFDAPAIVYTQPMPFNRNRLLIQMISVLAVACAFVMGLSVFFKVETITVSGAETYSPYKIEEASGIHKGDYLLTFGRARACGQITAKLPYINSVRIGIKLPNTVNIDVQEADVAYSIRSGDGDWWLITSEGKVVEQIPGTTSGGYTTVLGVQLENPVPGQLAVALEALPEETGAEGETEAAEETKENSLLEPPVTVSATMRLKSALRILAALEENDIVGDAATVNVENLEKIELWYGQKYQVNLGNTEQLEYKVACMYDAILQMSEYQNGMLDVSFTKKKDQVVYTPFV